MCVRTFHFDMCHACVLESCVYRYALECVFVYLSWFILSCKILIMWYMQPPPTPTPVSDALCYFTPQVLYI